MRSWVLVAALLTAPPVAFAEVDCDFEKPVGSCNGIIQLLKSGRSKTAYSAEVLVKSSSASCSAVEFDFERSRQTTFLRGENSKQERLFGTRPIMRNSLPVLKCTTYESFNASLTGTWSYKFDTAKTKGSVVVSIKDTHGSISGTWTSTIIEEFRPGQLIRKTDRKSFTGTRDGTSIQLKWERGSPPAHYELKGREIVDDAGQVWVVRQ
ncbi:hypothetical protein [Rhizobium sp. BK176]|uniref:hypothetical protein n=1 Tax=Rhizobium sp. BK176 TaxID=2587071 RepID=UPI00216964FF|nr:hypothetical protein [Rhizobium sp. BK176]MCS4089216.1 hypothetical protein [Rhizobium sp. BK176]